MLKIKYNAPAVLSFCLLSLLALGLNWLTGGWANAHLFSVYRASFSDPLTYLRFFTHVLGHAGYSHYIGNIVFLLVIGPALEEKYGSGRLLAVMAVTALVSGLIQFIFFPGTALLGASGIVYMMIVLSSFFGSRGGGIPMTLILVMLLYIGGEIIDMIFVSDNISQLTHIIGGIIGAVTGFALRK